MFYRSIKTKGDGRQSGWERIPKFWTLATESRETSENAQDNRTSAFQRSQKVAKMVERFRNGKDYKLQMLMDNQPRLKYCQKVINGKLLTCDA